MRFPTYVVIWRMFSDRADSFSRVQPNAKSFVVIRAVCALCKRLLKNTQKFIDLKTDLEDDEHI